MYFYILLSKVDQSGNVAGWTDQEADELTDLKSFIREAM